MLCGWVKLQNRDILKKINTERVNKNKKILLTNAKCVCSITAQSQYKTKIYSAEQSQVHVLLLSVLMMTDVVKSLGSFFIHTVRTREE